MSNWSYLFTKKERIDTVADLKMVVVSSPLKDAMATVKARARHIELKQVDYNARDNISRRFIQIEKENEDNLDILKATSQAAREITDVPSAGRRRGQKRRRGYSHLAAAREKAREKQEKPAAHPVVRDVNGSPVNDVPDETMELRTKQTVSYSENLWHVPFSQMVGTTSRAAERAVNTVLGCIDSVAKTPARESALMQELVSHSRFQAALQASGMPSRADWLIAEGVASELAHYRENNLHKTQHGRIANNAIARAAVSKLREVAVHGDFTLVRQRLGYSKNGLDCVMK